MNASELKSKIIMKGAIKTVEDIISNVDAEEAAELGGLIIEAVANNAERVIGVYADTIENLVKSKKFVLNVNRIIAAKNLFVARFRELEHDIPEATKVIMEAGDRAVKLAEYEGRNTPALVGLYFETKKQLKDAQVDAEGFEKAVKACEANLENPDAMFEDGITDESAKAERKELEVKALYKNLCFADTERAHVSSLKNEVELIHRVLVDRKVKYFI